MTDPGPGGQPAGPVRVRFAPSPSGSLHLGDVRTALYGWAFARHQGGAFVLRMEDTDPSRVTGEHIASAQETLHWLGLNWDEGPGQDGPYGPYRQSERTGLYHQWAQRFLDTGHAYWCYCSPEELEARRGEHHEADGDAGQADGDAGQANPSAADSYDRYCRTLAPDLVDTYLAQGRRPVLRFRMPDGPTTFTDLLRGEITVDHRDVPDFLIMRADGGPLPTLAAAVDDAMMRITHIVRGEELLAATPRQIAVYRAMGLPEDQFPVFAHLSTLLDDDDQKLSQHHGVTSIDWYRRAGYVPEALVNYLALLGWSPGGDSDEFSLDDLVGGFDLTQVKVSPAQFDPKQLEAINGVKIRALTPADFARRIVPFLARTGLVTEPLSSDQMWFIRQGAPLIQDRITRLTQAPDLLGFLLETESRFAVSAPDAAAVLTADVATPLKAAAEALAVLPEWNAAAIEAALRAALADGPGLDPGLTLAPVRVAVTGRRVSPPLSESMELLGRDPSLARLAAAQATLPGA